MSFETGILFYNIDLDPDTEYFFYIGELKGNCLNQFVSEALSKRFAKKFDFISILPDVLVRYPRGNILVLNPYCSRSVSGNGGKVSRRIPPGEFARMVSNSAKVRNLAEDLLQRQGRLFLHAFESMPQLTLNRMEGVTLLGPDAEMANKWNNKLHQLQVLADTDVPVVDFRICADYGEMLRVTRRLHSDWKDGIFVSRPYSAAGKNSFICRSPEDISDADFPPDSRYFVSKYIPHVADPTVLGVVANAREVFIAAVAEQNIEDGRKFQGSMFPSVLSSHIQSELRRHTRMIGRLLGHSGYRGIFGCDFLVDRRGRVHFVEINARKQGTTMEMCCTLENLLPPEAPSLLELEFCAVNESRFPKGIREISDCPAQICWETYNYKTEKNVQIEKAIPQEHDERELFRLIARKQLEHAYIILEHPGGGIEAEAGAFIGRVAAISGKRHLLEKDIERGREEIRHSLKKEKIKHE